MKQIIKKIFPEKLTFYVSALNKYIYDITRFVLYSNAYYKDNTLNKTLSTLTMKYHILEKGLTMPETRLGFGREVIDSLMTVVDKYIKRGYNQNNIEFEHSIGVIREYYEFHKKINFVLINEKEIKAFLVGKEKYKMRSQLIFKKHKYLKDKEAPFDKFCYSRKSIRNYSDEDISDSIFLECTNMAQSSPSACNRQPNKVYVIKDDALKCKILDLQNGNRGFGHLAKAIIVFTSDLSVWNEIKERNEVFFNSGLFSMTFMFALHLKEIGSCFLNWSVKKETDIRLHKLLDIPYNEIITVLISCGRIPYEIKITNSPRKEINNVLKII